MKKTAPQFRLEEFWKELEKRTVVKIEDTEKLRKLLCDFIVRCNYFVDMSKKKKKKKR